MTFSQSYINIIARLIPGLLLSAILAVPAHGQKMVEGSGYNLMLKTLLSHSVPEISVQEVISSPETYLFLDSREPKEFKVSHIEGAIPVGYDELDLSGLKDIPKYQPLVVYCSVGYRSEKVSEKLIEAGYNNVQNLYGGIFEWKNAGMPIVNERGPTDSIHVYSKAWGIWCHCEDKVSD
jgi:rhodanese-related sulfurtransferase